MNGNENNTVMDHSELLKSTMPPVLCAMLQQGGVIRHRGKVSGLVMLVEKSLMNQSLALWGVSIYSAASEACW